MTNAEKFKFNFGLYATELWAMSEESFLSWLNSDCQKVEPNRKFLEIIVEYPKVCIYPEYVGKPYYTIKYEENGEMMVGFGTYKPEVLSQYLREYFISSIEPERMAKVKDIASYSWLSNGRVYSHCGFDVVDDGEYCPGCDLKLNWSGNERLAMDCTDDISNP